MNTKISFTCDDFSLKALLKNHASEKHGEISIFLVGDLLGSLKDDGLIKKIGDDVHNHLIQHILCCEQIEELNLNFLVGSFTIVCVLHAQERIIVSVSTSCASPFILHKQQKITINFNGFIGLNSKMQ